MSFMKVTVDFDHKLRPWDGFGFNYVETAQTQDYSAEPQDYGGFSTLNEIQRQEIMDLVFGEDGLKPGLVKMFYDPWHQPKPEEPGDESLKVCMEHYDHETSTKWLRYFARNAVKISRERSQELQFITTLYGPPGWMTKQRELRGRDLDPAYRYACARYMVSWVKFLREQEGIPVKFISVHNEGEDYLRWRNDGKSKWGGHDYNLFWPTEQVVDFLRFGQSVLNANGLADVTFTPGECTNWLRFYEWGYADAIADDALALANMGLITSHGFSSLDYSRWFADWRSSGIDLLREKRPELHAWVTSTSWSNMDVFMLNEMRSNIYVAKVNGIIPWAGIQCSGLWKKGDPNPGTAIRILEDSTYKIEPGYYYYKHYCRAGQPGMAVARVSSNDTEVTPAAFSGNGTNNPDAFVLTNLSNETRCPNIILRGTAHTAFNVFQTTSEALDAKLGLLHAQNGILQVELPPMSVTSLFGN